MPSERRHATPRVLVAVAFLYLFTVDVAWGAQKGQSRLKDSANLAAVVGQFFTHTFRFNDANSPGNACPAGMTVIPTSPPPPPGLTFSQGGVLQGTPTLAGAFPIGFDAIGPDPQGPCGTRSSFLVTLKVQPRAASEVVANVVTPQAQVAVTAVTQQLGSIQQRLDNLRIARNPTVMQGLTASYDGGALPPLGTAASLPLDKDGKAILQRGGGASADKDTFERWGFYVQADADVGTLKGTGSQAGFDADTYGLTIGSDYRLAGNNVLGATLGLLKANADLNNDAGSQDTRGWSLSIYGEYVPAENAYIDLAVTYGRNRYDGVRRDTLSTSVFEYDSSPHGDQFGAAISAGYQFYYQALTLTPYGRLEYANASIDGFQENSANGGPNPLIVSRQRYKSTVVTIGGQAQYAWSQTWGVLVPYVRAEYQYAVQTSANAITAQYVGLAGSQAAPIPGSDKSYGNIAVGASAIAAHGLSGYFNYQYLFAKQNFDDSRFTLGIRYEF